MKLNRHCCGFSLVELVTSLAIISILIVAMGSAMVIAARGIPDPNDPIAMNVDAAGIIDQIASELAYAVTILTSTATEIEFVVNRNGKPITILYIWGGTPGDPLIRAYNGFDVTVIENVQEFALTYNLKTPDQVIVVIEGPEELFLAQDKSNSGTADVFTLTGNAQCAELFKPVLPDDAVSWSITRVKFIASPDGNTQGSLAVDVMTVNQGTMKPASSLETVLIPEADLVANNWHEVQFNNAGGLSLSEGFFIAFSRASGGGIVALLSMGTGSTDSPETTYWDTLGGGWSEYPTKDIWLWVWGKVMVPDPDSPPPVGALSSVQIQLQVGTDTSTKIQTQVQVLNVPDVSG